MSSLYVSSTSILIVSHQNVIQSNSTMTITSDDDLTEMATSGTGTLNDPFILRVNIFKNWVNTMEVSNTRTYFIITKSLIWNRALSDFALAFKNVSHGSIEDSIIRGYDYSSDAGILVDNCTDVRIIRTNINDCAFGIQLSGVKECLISNCTIYNNADGIHFYSASSTLITWNTLVHNDIGISAAGSTNRIYGNRIGWSSLNGYDYGTNAWDDGMSIGNSWSDYDGEGVYEILGQNAGVDHYPSILQEGDYSGPVITNVISDTPAADLLGLSIEHVKISVDVADLSGVDTVLLWSLQNGTFEYQEMILDGTSENGSYSYVFEGPFSSFSLDYFIWANDSEGYDNISEFCKVEFYPQYGIKIFSLIIYIVPVALVITVLILFTRRWYRTHTT